MEIKKLIAKRASRRQKIRDYVLQGNTKADAARKFRISHARVRQICAVECRTKDFERGKDKLLGTVMHK